MPVRRWIKSVNHAIEGVLHAARSERHLRYHFYTVAVVLVVCYVIGVTRVEFLLIVLAMMAVLLAEMMNTALEYVVDLLSPEMAEKAGRAKDVAAGGVLVTAFGAAVMGVVILQPYIWRMLTGGFRVSQQPPFGVALLAFVIVVIGVVLLKSYFGKGTPLSGGMPSGHAAVAFSVWVTVTMSTGSIIVSVLCLALALAVAHSRVSGGAHSVFEAVVGGAFGTAVTFILFMVFS